MPSHKKGNERNERLLQGLIAMGQGGTVPIRTRSAKGTTNGVVLIHRPTRLQYSGQFQISRYFARKLRPIKVNPVTVYDGAGKPIATITVDPVTGARKRTPL